MMLPIGGAVADYFKYVDDLKSTDWLIRNKALDVLSKIDDADVLVSVFWEIEGRREESSVVYFFPVCDRLMLNEDPELCGVALFCLLYWLPRYKRLQFKCKNSIKNFLDSSSQYRYVKVLALRQAFLMLTQKNRDYVTKLIGQYKFVELAPLLMINFKSPNRDLVLLTIKIFDVLEDPRANRYLRKFIYSKDRDLAINSMEVLGRLGDFFDTFYFIPILLKSKEDDLMYFSTIKALTRLNGNYSLYFLKRYLQSVTNIELKKKAIWLFEHLNSIAARKFLIEEYVNEEDDDISFVFEMALREISQRKLIDLFIEKFYKVDELKKLKILQYLSDVQDMKVLKLMQEVAMGNYDDMLVMTASDCLPSFNEPSSVSILQSQLVNIEKNTSYYSLLSLLAHDFSGKREYVSAFIERLRPDQALLHEALLTFFRERYLLTIDDPVVEQYILNMSFHERDNNRYLAVRAASKFHTQTVFKRLVDVLYGDDKDFIKIEAAFSLIKSFTVEPELLDIDPSVLNNELVVKYLSSDKIKSSLVRKSLLVISKGNISEYNLFLKKFSVIICSPKFYDTNLLKEYPLVVETLINIFYSYEEGASRRFVKFLINEIYPYSKKEMKYKILLFVASKTVDNNDFVIKESFGLDLISYERKILFRSFFSGLEIR